MKPSEFVVPEPEYARRARERGKIDQCSLGESEIAAALDHLRAAAVHYQRGGREPFAKNITRIVEELRKEAVGGCT